MAEIDTKLKYNPWALCQCLDDCAKWWWGASITAKILGFLIGALAIVLGWPSKPMPFVLALLTVLSEISGYRSDSIKGMAQALRRKLDLKDGLGWEVPNTEFSDLVVRCPASVKKRASAIPDTEPYFASQQKPGPRRALENVAESAWWSKHLSEKMGFLCSVLLFATVAGAIVALVGTVQMASQIPVWQGTADTLSAIARVVTALLMLALSLGVVKLALGYYAFSKKSGRVEESADRLLAKGKSIDMVDSLKLVNEYHIARAGAPIIPTWVWKLNRGELNAIWSDLRKSSKQQQS